MAPIEPPKLDERTAEDFLIELVKLIPTYFPEWKADNDLPADTDPSRERLEILGFAEDKDDVGMAFLKMAARMGEVIVGQLNRVPQKNFLTFLDFMEIDPFPPRAARVPLSFVLAEGAKKPGFVPRKAKVGVVDAEDIVFETESDLIVGPTRVKRLVSLHPATDQWTDHALAADGAASGDAALLFHGDPAERRIDHILWLGHSRLLDLANAYGLSVRLHLMEPAAPFVAFFDSLRWEASPGWDMQVPKLEQSGKNEITLHFSGLPKIEESQVVGVDAADRERSYSSRWLRARTTQPVSAGLPKVQSLYLVVAQGVDASAPDLAFANAAPLDISKDFFPFGERPRFNDTFYIASQGIFSKAGARVSIDIALSARGPAKPDTTTITLDWEYWDGKEWEQLGQSIVEPPASGTSAFHDESSAFTKDGRISFVCPPISKASVNGKENYWIRVRITDGDYGKEAQLVLTDSAKSKSPDELTLADYKYSEASFKPPSVATISITSDYTESAPPEICLLSTAGLYRDMTGVRPFPLAEQPAETSPTLYLGLAGLEKASSASIDLYFLLNPWRFGEYRPGVIGDGSGRPALVGWEYWNGSAWTRLSVEDETQNLAQGGVIRFGHPSDMGMRKLFGEQLVWIRGSLAHGDGVNPRLGGVFPNTVWATQAITVEGETLGSSNEQPDQVFSLSKSPVLDGEIIEVREPAMPSGNAAVQTTRDDAGNVTAIWVRWWRVNRLTASGPGDRHYVIDRANGKVLFGDGINGLIPPAGKSNVRASNYRWGGGRGGNRPVGVVSVLKSTFPSVDSVTNRQPSSGGDDQEDLDHVMARGPHTIKNRNRAVTTEDFEWLARQESGQIALTRCLANVRIGPSGALAESQGWVTLVIVPDEDGDRPIPTETLLLDVKQSIAKKCLASLADRIDVIGPSYVEITVEVDVIAGAETEEKMVEKSIDASLRSFLHPLGGGPAGAGWEFGRGVSLLEIIRVVNASAGVDRIRDISMSAGQGEASSVTFPVNGLPCSGRHVIQVARS